MVNRAIVEIVAAVLSVTVTAPLTLGSIWIATKIIDRRQAQKAGMK